MMAKTVRWTGLVMMMFALGWVSGVVMRVAKAMLTGQRLDPSILLPSINGYN